MYTRIDSTCINIHVRSQCKSVMRETKKMKLAIACENISIFASQNSADDSPGVPITFRFFPFPLA